MSNAALQRYFHAVETIVKANNGTEHTYRPALKAFLEELRSGITATNEAKRIKCGAPDYVIERENMTIGYVEAKDINEPLDKLEKDEQLLRYRRALSNLVFTDYLEFRWFVQGEGSLAEKKMTARLATLSGKKLIFDKEGAARVVELLTSFLEHKAIDIVKPEDLARRMARLTHMIRDVIVQAFKSNEASKTMRGQLVAFDKTLLLASPKNNLPTCSRKPWPMVSSQLATTTRATTHSLATMQPAKFPARIPSCANSLGRSIAAIWTRSHLWALSMSWPRCWKPHAWMMYWRISASARARKIR